MGRFNQPLLCLLSGFTVNEWDLSIVILVGLLGLFGSTTDVKSEDFLDIVSIFHAGILVITFLLLVDINTEITCFRHEVVLSLAGMRVHSLVSRLSYRVIVFTITDCGCVIVGWRRLSRGATISDTMSITELLIEITEGIFAVQSLDRPFLVG